MNNNDLDVRIDWTKLLADVAYMLGEPMQGSPVRMPVSQEQLAHDLGVSRGTLRNWMDGSEPRHSDGEQLLARWCQLTGKARTFAPTQRALRQVAARWEQRKETRRQARPEPVDEGPSLDQVWGRPRAMA